MEKIRVVLIAGLILLGGSGATEDVFPTKVDFGSHEYCREAEEAKGKRAFDAKTLEVWAKARYDKSFKKQLLDFYNDKGFRKVIKRDWKDYVKANVFDVAEKHYPKDSADAEMYKLPSYVLVSRKELIKNKVVEWFGSRDRSKLEAGLKLAAEHALKLPDGTYARLFEIEEKGVKERLPVIAFEDIPNRDESIPDWAVYYLEQSEDGNGVNYICIDPQKYSTLEEFQEARYIEAMLELCQHLGATNITFNGTCERKTELDDKVHVDSRINMGPVFLAGELNAKMNEDVYTKRVSKISTKFSGSKHSPSVNAELDHYSPYLQRQLKSEMRAQVGSLYHIYRSRTCTGNPMGGKFFLFHSWNSKESMSLTADLRAGFRTFGIPLGTFADVKIARKRNMDLEKVWVWTIEFPSPKNESDQ